MLTKTSSVLLLIAGVATLILGLYFATNTAVAAPAGLVVVHEENQPVANQTAPQPEQKLPAEGEMNTTPTPSSATSVPTQKPSSAVPTTPASLSIPSISLSALITKVGLNSKGEMDVPDGSTSNVGWYVGGTLPGNEGSAVLDAHVFAALKNLRYARVGDSIYVTDAAGVVRRFVVRSSMVYELAAVPRELLFNRTGGRYLNLITCAGSFVPAMHTYDHRLVVYAELVNE